MNPKQIITIILLCLITIIVLLFGCSDKPIISDKSSYSLLGSDPIDPNVVKNYPQSLPVFPTIPFAIDNSNMLPPIGNQGGLGACTGWAYGYYMRSALAKRQWNVDFTDLHNICSPAFLYGMSIQASGKDFGKGINPKIVQDTLVKWGTNSIYESPYSDSATSFNTNKIDNNVYRIDSYKTIDALNRNDIKAELTTGNMINVSLFLYTDFTSYKEGVYKGNGTWWISGLKIQSHAMCMVGFDDDKQAYKIVNSWGPDWGDKGFVWIDYGTFENMCNIAFVSYNYSSTKPEPIPDQVFSTIECKINESYQYKANNGWHILYFDVEFNQPIYLKEITVLSPDGTKLTQPNDMWFRRGVIYYYRDDNVEFPGGTYTLRFNNDTFYGVSNQMEITATISGSYKQLKASDWRGVKGMNHNGVF